MFESIGIGNETLVIFVSAVAAMLSFIAVVLPLLNRNQKKEHFQSVIERRRKDLFAQTRAEIAQKGVKTLTASESVAASFKVKKMMGEMGEKVRGQMLMAGIRSPTAPMKYMIARIVLPFFAMGVAMIFISAAEEPPGKIVILLILLVSVLVGYFLPRILLKNMIVKRAQEINLAFSDALDLMLICVQGGIGLEQTVQRIAEEISEHSPVLAEELGILSAEMAMLNDRRAALQDFARRVGSGAARNFATALIQAEQYGTSVSQAMRVISSDLREQRMALAEQKAASLPPKLTVPMIAFFLPVLFVIILVPTVIKAMGATGG
ncbi:MAG: type II secretion system F family protein [Micavibrio aeruginosavorus]|uniref:Type II secretion system F family protein n=1 Tax=Micavibrio aeruginosavorus TaxID=349221 RepID=A0A7T5UIR8_9BACT|nr:MAG: type II secretion system F family protein [Micavibrio aeruginosavorus]